MTNKPSWGGISQAERKRTMARISIDGGKTYTTPEVAISHVVFERILSAADEEDMNRAHKEMGTGSIFDLLHKYLEISDKDIIVG